MSDLACGSCLCGGVRFSLRLPSKWMGHCHCTVCRRAHGAAFVTWVGAEEKAVRIEEEEGRLKWYGSSDGAERGFCSRCGSTLFFRSEQWPGELHMVRANFDDPLDREPEAHGYYDTHVDWVELADELPRRPDPAA